MTNRQKPPDWDWVKERGRCSLAVVYEILRGLATANVATRNGQSEHEAKHERFRLTNSAAVQRGFLVIDAFGEERRTVAIEVVENQIRIRSSFLQEETVYDLSLNDDGECRLVSGGLRRWPCRSSALAS